jgi:hypothetical protein
MSALRSRGRSRTLRQCGASEGALAIRGHDRRPRTSDFNRIAPPAAMLLDETGAAAGILARHRRSGTRVHLAIRPHCEQAETEPSAKVPKPHIACAPLLARRKASGEPNFVACGSAIDPLQDEFKIEGQLEFADRHDMWIVVPQRQQIAASDFTLDNEAEPFEEGLDRPIEQRLQCRSPGSFQLEASFGRLGLLKRSARPNQKAAQTASRPAHADCPDGTASCRRRGPPQSCPVVASSP